MYQGAPELCDGVDNDCDSNADEGDIPVPDDFVCLTAGVCGGTMPVCRDDAWRCDYPAGHEAGAEVSCDGLDNDCDGVADDDFDFATDARHCGGCDRPCAYPHAAGICADATCGLGACEADWYDRNGDSADGCEYACQASGDEVCNQRDDDCDGEVDEGFDLLSDPSHCGQCGRACAVDHGAPACVDAVCAVEDCDDGWHDVNGEAADGCEYACVFTRGGQEVCDQIDNDCDGTVDNGFDTDRDPAHCGGCNQACDLPEAVAGCVEGVCVVRECAPGFVDLDDNPANGCELRCTPTPNPADVCDGVDNDCDGVVDEGFDLQTDEQNCGRCGAVCAPANATGQCLGGDC
ncbi:MAG: hypothetical protein KC549_07440, partial [Myxococcales bacterium]|nr:hypothetical protein [Myxococcales bacterium]